MSDVLSWLQGHVLAVLVFALAVVSVALSPRAVSGDTFFRGSSPQGRLPGFWMLTLSQVTTWIFARSLLNAAILGYYYGLWGALAYAAYYLSFLTGGAIIDSLRFRHGHASVQDFLRERFGTTGTSCYNLTIGLRLVSEVFANVLVIGILFGATGSTTYVAAVLLFSGITLLYSLLGGLYASLRTDVVQMILFLGVLGVLCAAVFGAEGSLLAILEFKPFVASEPGPVLLAVALLQVWSYPMHDPVMMDRGFISDRATTRRSFRHAAWISFLCITAFGCIGVLAGVQASPGESMNAVLERWLGEHLLLLFNAALVISAMSTLDSALSSAAKLAVIDGRWVAPTLRNGRLVMLAFMGLGLLLVFLGNDDLFAAVAVSGTASLYLAPVVFFSLWGGRTGVPVWAYLGSFLLAVAGSVLYFTESSGYSAWMGDMHKYTKLLWICFTVLIGGCLLFWIGLLTSGLAAVRGSAAAGEPA